MAGLVRLMELVPHPTDVVDKLDEQCLCSFATGLLAGMSIWYAIDSARSEGLTSFTYDLRAGARVCLRVANHSPTVLS